MKPEKELMEVVTGYTSAGVVTADEPLEDHIRKAHNLPKKAEGELIDNQEAQDEEVDVEDPIEETTEEEVELSEKSKGVKGLIEEQAIKISNEIKKHPSFFFTKNISTT